LIGAGAGAGTEGIGGVNDAAAGIGIGAVVSTGFEVRE
jgi:hypothetical protein